MFVGQVLCRLMFWIPLCFYVVWLTSRWSRTCVGMCTDNDMIMNTQISISSYNLWSGYRIVSNGIPDIPSTYVLYDEPHTTTLLWIFITRNVSMVESTQWFLFSVIHCGFVLGSFPRQLQAAVSCVVLQQACLGSHIPLHNLTSVWQRENNITLLDTSCLLHVQGVTSTMHNTYCLL